MIFFSHSGCWFYEQKLTNHLYHVGLTFPSEKGGIVFLGTWAILTHRPACEKDWFPPTGQRELIPRIIKIWKQNNHEIICKLFM